ncbi:serine/threonine-protein kinase H2 isoform X1 [Homo sapiens]|uniref:serine/threonine-protein kinase H2 isoform X1 n=1 Tax=Homo sapiens TaxID=9606 RepID=UPI0007DC4ED5|nr:serine/threonine-protein kinase H2 isoform X1 [Homo sapiens]XP_054217387.1 serine/threonine-protein kinase H2 isoform X1 [Homo sapiens]|eukprot:XP_016869418.1 serine/threonine-protein kinase H2 isoform X1 [Homo sapiens]
MSSAKSSLEGRYPLYNRIILYVHFVRLHTQTVTSDDPGVSVVSGYPGGCLPDHDPPVGFLSEGPAPRSCSLIKGGGTGLAASRVPRSRERRACCGYGVRRQQEGGPGATSAGLGQARRSKPSRRRRRGAWARGGGPGGAEDTGGSLPSQVRPPGPCQGVQRMGKKRAGAAANKGRNSYLRRYDIKALIGTGSFSRVVRVEQKTTKKPFAIKVMETREREGREACVSELSVLRRVSHRYIVQLMEIFETEDQVYMVMELATGGELFDRLIAQGSFTERDAVRILQMVADGIRYLHALQITHRNLKPENLLYYHPGEESKILITDFGLAYSGKKSGDWTMKTLCGTPEYIAPEVLLRKPYTSAVDMWALGVITYALLSGFLPFDDESQTRLYRKILKGKYNYTGEPWPSISHLAKDFIDKLLILEAGHRMSAGQALDHPWVITMAAGSSMKNLQRAISRNLMQRASPHSQSPGSAQSSKSHYSHKSRHMWSKRNLRIVESPLSALL